MFYNGKPLHLIVEKFIEDYTGESILDDGVSLESLGVFEHDVFGFTFAVAEHFGFDDRIKGDEIGNYACVFNVTMFVEENL